MLWPLFSRTTLDHALSLVEIGNRDSEEPALTFRSCQPPSLSAAPVPDRQLLLHFEWGGGEELGEICEESRGGSLERKIRQKYAENVYRGLRGTEGFPF